jgi:hypothetical protein
MLGSLEGLSEDLLEHLKKLIWTKNLSHFMETNFKKTNYLSVICVTEIWKLINKRKRFHENHI